MKIEYIKVGDYYIPNLALPEEHRPIGLWGQLHKRYLEEHRTAMYQSMILSCTLWTYLADLNEQAEQRYDLIVEQMKAALYIKKDGFSLAKIKEKTHETNKI